MPRRLCLVFANLVLLLQIGAPDVAFPGWNAFRSGLFVFATIGQPAYHSAPWTSRDRHIAADRHSLPGSRGDLWIMGLIVAVWHDPGRGQGITTVVCMRAPGMTFGCRLHLEHHGDVHPDIDCVSPLTAVLFSWPGAHIGDAANGGVLLWQHLFCSSPPRGLHHRAAVFRPS